MKRFLLIAISFVIYLQSCIAADPWIVLSNYSGPLCEVQTSISIYKGGTENITYNSCETFAGDLLSQPPFSPRYGKFQCSPSSSTINFYDSDTCSNPAGTPLPSTTFCANESTYSYRLVCQDGRTVDVVNQWGSTVACASVTYSDSACNRSNVVSIEAVEDPSGNYDLRIGPCQAQGAISHQQICGSYFQVIDLFYFTTYYKGLQFLVPPPNPPPVSPLLYLLATSDQPNTASNTLYLFNASDPSTAISVKQITGTEMGERILGIDLRVSNNVLYAIGDASTLYTINTDTGAATLIGSFPDCLNTSEISATDAWSTTINPKEDYIYVNNIAGYTWRINPDTAACEPVGTRAYYRGPGRPLGGICGGYSAYTNNLPDLPADANSTLYTLNGQFIIMAPTETVCMIVVDGYLSAPFDIYTSLDYENTPFAVRQGVLLTFSLDNEANLTNIGVFPALPSGYIYNDISVLPPTYSPTLPTPTSSPTTPPTSSPTPTSSPSTTPPTTPPTPSSSPSTSPTLSCSVTITPTPRAWGNMESQVWDLILTNSGTSPISSLSITLSPSPSTTLSQFWNLNFISGNSYTVEFWESLNSQGDSYDGVGVEIVGGLSPPSVVVANISC